VESFASASKTRLIARAFANLLNPLQHARLINWTVAMRKKVAVTHWFAVKSALASKIAKTSISVYAAKRE